MPLESGAASTTCVGDLGDIPIISDCACGLRSAPDRLATTRFGLERARRAALTFRRKNAGSGPRKPSVRFNIFEWNRARWRETTQPGPAAAIDRLYLVNASGLPAFRPVYEALSRMGFYSLNPDSMRDLQSPDAGDLLARDGSHIASVLAQLKKNNPTEKSGSRSTCQESFPAFAGSM